MSKLEDISWMNELSAQRDKEILANLLDVDYMKEFSARYKKDEFKLWSKQLMRELFDTSEKQTPKPIDIEKYLELVKRKRKEYNEGKKR